MIHTLFVLFPACGVRKVTMWWPAASRASGDAARHGAGLLLIPAANEQDVSPRTVRNLIFLDKREIVAAEVIC